VTNTGLSRRLSGGVSWSVLDLPEGVTLNAGNYADRISVLGTLTPVTINADGGDDNVYLAGSTGRLDNINALVNVRGDGGTDATYIDDRNNASSTSYTISSSSLTRPFVSPLNFGQIERLFLYAGSGSDTINVLNRSLSTTVWIYAGPG